MNIYEAIRNDHDIQRDLGSKLLQTSGESPERAELFACYKEELVYHANAEERHFYKPLISNDMMQEHARHGIAEHHEIDELIEELNDTEYSSSGWLVTCKKLVEKVEHHLEDEERTFFQLSGKVFSDTQKEALAKEYVSFMDDQRRGG
ncbi:MAG: hemerythrin domain-containing protein [Akkermansiaceae bacterium]